MSSLSSKESLLPATPVIFRAQIFSGNYSHAVLKNCIYIDCEFSEIEWRETTFYQVKFSNCRFNSATFIRCKIDDTCWENCCIDSCYWLDCLKKQCSIISSEMNGYLFERGNIISLNLVETKGHKWVLKESKSQHVSAAACDVIGLSIKDGNWSDTSWVGGSIADFTADRLSIERFIVAQTSCKKVQTSNSQGNNVRWINCEICDLLMISCSFVQAAWSHSRWSSGALLNCNLPLACFNQADISNIAFRNTEMPRALFDCSILSECDMSEINAPGLSLRDATLKSVLLRNAAIKGVDARGAQLSDVDLNNADCENGLLIGQPKTYWSRANDDTARYAEESVYDDADWWVRNSPGVRGKSI